MIDDFMLSDEMHEEQEVFSFVSSGVEKEIKDEDLLELLPVLPLRNTVLFPHVLIPISVGREHLLKLLQQAYDEQKVICVVSQKDKNIDNPKKEDLYGYGTIAHVIKILKMPDGSTTAIIQGNSKCKLEDVVLEDVFLKAKVSLEKDKKIRLDNNFKAMVSTMKDLASQIIKKSSQIPNESNFALQNIDDSQILIHYICSNLNVEVQQKQELLELNSLHQRAKQTIKYLDQELQALDLKNQIWGKVRKEMNEQQRHFILNQQLKTIQEELGDSPNKQDINELKEKAAKKKWSKEVGQIFEKELTKLERMNPSMMEYTIQLNYLENMVDLPWNEYTKDNFNLKRAEEILHEDHFGLDDVKDRILEYLAVLKLKGNMKSPILCLVGPPGVGKTSLGKSIARAINRKYVRVSLGGLRDEAEIRGHRRTYIGAMPGRIIQNIKKVQSSNPVFMLDEIDKIMGMNVNGDPSAALLEVLDPEQNSTFHDNYLDIDYDLSKVMFIATANTLNSLHPALRDRMEIIQLQGYLAEEKVEIAKRHLIPKQLKEHGISDKEIEFSDEVLKKMIEDYTRESGVRTLDKRIAKVLRNKAKKIVLKSNKEKQIHIKDLKDILGVKKFSHDMSLEKDTVGVVTGLAWTSAGGEILFVEVSLSNGKGDFSITGNLGDVMKESAKLSFEYLKAHAKDLGIDTKQFKDKNVHIHIPEGATPKDGPSAGIALFTALASAFLNQKVKKSIAMTGEITLRGKVLPVGGIKEKILAAKRAKIKEIVLCKENQKNIEEINKEYIKGLKFHYIDEMKDVLKFAMV